MANLGLLNNNPGNLKNPKTGSFQVFNSPDEGQQALINDIKIKQSGQSSHIKPGASLEQFANVWAPSSDNNNPKNYANTLAKVLGINTAEAFDTVPPEKLAEAIKVAEGTSSMKSSTPQTKLSVDDFGAKIKAKHPEYSDLDNNTLTQKILAKYPQYSDMVDSPVSNRKTFSDSIKTSDTPQPTQIKQPDATAPGNFISNIQKGHFGDALQSGIRDVGSALTFGGSEQLGNELGKSLAFAKEKAKGLLGGQDNSNYVPEPSFGKTVGGALKTVTGVGLLGGGGKLLSGVLGKGSELSKPAITEILNNAAGPGETAATMGRQNAINALGNALKEQSVHEAGGKLEQSLLKALQELNPTLIEKKSLLSKLAGGGYQLAKGTVLAKLLGDTVGGFFHNATK